NQSSGGREPCSRRPQTSTYRTADSARGSGGIAVSAPGPPSGYFCGGAEPCGGQRPHRGCEGCILPPDQLNRVVRLSKQPAFQSLLGTDECLAVHAAAHAAHLHRRSLEIE